MNDIIVNIAHRNNFASNKCAKKFERGKTNPGIDRIKHFNYW